MSATHIILDNLPSLRQKLSDLVEVWRSYNKNNFACFFETRCISHFGDNLLPGAKHPKLNKRITKNFPYLLINIDFSVYGSNSCSNLVTNLSIRTSVADRRLYDVYDSIVTHWLEWHPVHGACVDRNTANSRHCNQPQEHLALNYYNNGQYELVTVVLKFMTFTKI